MDIIKRTAKVIAFPFTGVWWAITYGIMATPFVVGTVSVTAYSIGKYIITGDGGLTVPIYINNALENMDYIANLYFLFSSLTFLNIFLSTLPKKSKTFLV